MKYSSLLNNFIDTLHQRINKRNRLVSFISETLEIERESASRRLSGKVNFSIEEMGILALKLGISLDNLLYRQGEHFHFASFTMYSPMQAQSINTLTLGIEADIELLSIIEDEPTEYGSMFTSLPLEFVIPYKSLLKFIYFKWGYYYLATSDFEDYASWEVRKDLLTHSYKIKKLNNKLNRVIYIWDISVIWSFVKDVIYFSSIGALNKEDIKTIKEKLHEMLYQLKETIKRDDSSLTVSREIEMYISTVHLGADFSYLISENKNYSNFHTYFIGTGYNNDYKTTTQLRDWINSMKKVCSLISGSGARERNLFFEEQHNIVDTIDV
ncbi:MAG: hypothetical protein E6772_06220 [Dysgonomonas sp.]|nr:hypothetical protein [Dysgonomonas sp.]